MSIPRELNSLDFGALIGGPLTAVIDAQKQSALATVDFVQSVGFDTTEDGNQGPLRMTAFSWTSENEAGESTTRELSLPFLTMLQVPAIRIESTEINFNAKINSIHRSASSSSTSANLGVSGGFGPVKFNASVSTQRKSSSSSSVARSYSLEVKVRAVQDEMPSGLAKIFEMLEEEIKSTTVSTEASPAPAPAPEPQLDLDPAETGE